VASSIAVVDDEHVPAAAPHAGGSARRSTVARRLKGVAVGMRAWARREPWQVLALLFAAVGIWLRTRRFFGSSISLWADEAHWLIQLLKTPISKPSIRPVGFMAVSRYLAEQLGPSEVVIRFLPWLFGVLTALLVVPLAWRLFRAPTARLLSVAVPTLHPMAIDLSKEFKPYTISLFSHLCCLWCAASYWEVGKKRWLLATMGVSLVGVLFSQDVVFAYPGLYLALGLSAWKRRRFRHLALTAGGMSLTLGLLGALYWYFWRFVGGAGGAGNKQVSGLASAWWSAGYDLFYTGTDPNESHLAWIARKVSEVAAFPGSRRKFWSPWGSFEGPRLDALSSIDQSVWASIALVGVVCLVWQKRGRELLLLALPLLVVFAFNLKGLWPLGAFRSDLFLLAYTTAIACVALDARVGSERPLRPLVPVALLVLAPLAVFERVWHEHKNAGGELVPAVKAAVRLQGLDYEGRREVLVLDGFLCEVWRYYQDYHPRRREEFRRLRKRFSMKCVSSWGQPTLKRAQQVLRDSHERFWLLSAATPERDFFARGAPEGYELLAREEIPYGQTQVVALRRR